MNAVRGLGSITLFRVRRAARVPAVRVGARSGHLFTMFHAVPLLWRLHRVHHADLGFDVTTRTLPSLGDPALHGRSDYVINRRGMCEAHASCDGFRTAWLPCGSGGRKPRPPCIDPFASLDHTSAPPQPSWVRTGWSERDNPSGTNHAMSNAPPPPRDRAAPRRAIPKAHRFDTGTRGQPISSAS